MFFEDSLNLSLRAEPASSGSKILMQCTYGRYYIYFIVCYSYCPCYFGVVDFVRVYLHVDNSLDCVGFVCLWDESWLNYNWLRLPKESRGMFLLFKGEDFVSYAGYGGATANTIRVTNVFTATDFRGQGYGQLICWYASRRWNFPQQQNLLWGL